MTPHSYFFFFDFFLKVDDRKLTKINRKKTRISTHFATNYLHGFRRSRYALNNRQFLFNIGQELSSQINLVELPVPKKLSDFQTLSK